MKQTDKELERIVGKDPGFKVPEKYFDDVFNKINSQLPAYELPSKPKLTTWQRIKPYVYLAAMFAGIWCMMKMFHIASLQGDSNLENPPALVAEAISNGTLSDEVSIMSYDDFAYFDVEDSVIADYDNINEIETDFKQITDETE